MELISVIIPAYNVEKYLARCLDSVCGQTYGNIEIIVVDDGSTDTTAAICDEYAGKDARIKAVHKQNEGVAAARNTALDTVAGDCIAFADADDYMEPDMLKQLHKAMCEYDADMVSCGYYEEYPDRTDVLGTGKGILACDRHKAYEEYFKMGGRIGSGCWNKLIKAEALKDIRYKPYVMGEDVELLSRVLDRCSRVICIDYPGYHYIHRKDSATQTMFRAENMDIIRVVEEMSDYFKVRHPELIKQFYGFHAAWYVATLQVMKRSGNMNRHKAEQAVMRRGIAENMRHYRDNPYVYRVDLLLLKSFMLHCFVPVQSMYETIRKIRHKA